MVGTPPNMCSGSFRAEGPDLGARQGAELTIAGATDRATDHGKSQIWQAEPTTPDGAKWKLRLMTIVDPNSVRYSGHWISLNDTHGFSKPRGQRRLTSFPAANEHQGIWFMHKWACKAVY
jgi:hypothetical protein